MRFSRVQVPGVKLGAESASGEHGHGDQGFGRLEAGGPSGEDAEMGVGLDPGVAEVAVEGCSRSVASRCLPIVRHSDPGQGGALLAGEVFGVLTQPHRKGVVMLRPGLI